MPKASWLTLTLSALEAEGHVRDLRFISPQLGGLGSVCCVSVCLCASAACMSMCIRVCLLRRYICVYVGGTYVCLCACICGTTCVCIFVCLCVYDAVCVLMGACAYVSPQPGMGPGEGPLPCTPTSSRCRAAQRYGCPRTEDPQLRLFSEIIARISHTNTSSASWFCSCGLTSLSSFGDSEQ